MSVNAPIDVEKQEPPNQLQDRRLVDWDKNDPSNPKTWGTGYKLWITFQLNLLAFAASLGSSIISPAQSRIALYVGVSDEVAVLSVSLYVLGFALGPLMWAPVSELWGRRWSLLPAMFCLGLFSIGTATSKTAAAVFVTRFFGGVFGSAPVSNVSAALGDIWEAKTRGYAMTFYALCVVGGPTLGPVIGAAATVNKHLGWRWTEYIEAIVVFACFGLTLVCLPELYPSVLLARKAKALRKETGDDSYFHPHEDIKLDAKSILTKHFTRPLVMLATEPIVMCIAIYASFAYGLLYMTLEVFPIVYTDTRHWAAVPSSLPFLAMFIGILCVAFVNIAFLPRYARLVGENKGKPVPEGRLPPMIIGSLIFPVGLFWFGWTATPNFQWAIPTVATALIGGGFNLIFQQCINFLVDSYGLYAASATSANTFLRSLMAAGLPLAARPMFSALGIGKSMSIIGALAAAAIPVPLLFVKYAATLRGRSKFAMQQGGR